MNAPFTVTKRIIGLPISFFVSKCGDCGQDYVLFGVVKHSEGEELIPQNGGYYCPYCGNKLKFSPENYKELMNQLKSE